MMASTQDEARRLGALRKQLNRKRKRGEAIDALQELHRTATHPKVRLRAAILLIRNDVTPAAPKEEARS